MPYHKNMEKNMMLRSINACIDGLGNDSTIILFQDLFYPKEKKKILYIFQTGHQTLKRGDLAKYNSFSSQVWATIGTIWI